MLDSPDSEASPVGLLEKYVGVVLYSDTIELISEYEVVDDETPEYSEVDDG